MNRRKFFGFVAAAPVAVAAMPENALANGGHVRFPRHPYTIGEGGSEAVIPLRKAQTISLKVDEVSMANIRRVLDERDAAFRRKIVRLHAPNASQAFVDGDGI